MGFFVRLLPLYELFGAASGDGLKLEPGRTSTLAGTVSFPFDHKWHSNLLNQKRTRLYTQPESSDLARKLKGGVRSKVSLVLEPLAVLRVGK